MTSQMCNLGGVTLQENRLEIKHCCQQNHLDPSFPIASSHNIYTYLIHHQREMGTKDSRLYNMKATERIDDV